MKKRLIATVLVITLALSLTACGGNSASQQTTGNTPPPEGSEKTPVTLTLTCYGSETDAKAYEERAALLHEKYPEIILEIMNLPNDGYDAKVQTMIASDTVPDIIQTNEASNSYASKGVFTDLGELATQAGLDVDARFGSAADAYKWQDKLYAMPDRGGAMVVYYNRDMFDAAGVEYPSKEWTWDDFLSAAQKLTLTDDSGVVTQYGFAAGGWWPWWMSFMYQNGGRVLDETLENVVVNAPENVEAINFYTDLVHKYKVAPSADDYSRFGLQDGKPDPLFAQGNTAMCITGYWNVASLTSVEGLNWDMAPVWGNKENATFAFGTGLAIPTNSKHVAEAFKAIEFLTSVEGQTPIVTNNEDAPANVELLKSDLFLHPDWAKNLNINFGAFADSADMLKAPPLHPQWNEIQRVFDANFSVLFQKGGDSADTLKQIETELKGVIAG